MKDSNMTLNFKPFDYIDLGTKIEQLFICSSFIDFDKFEQNDYIKMLEVCNKKLEELSIDYRIDGEELINFPQYTKIFEISEYFAEPEILCKKNLFEIGYNLILFTMINISHVGTEDLNSNSIYHTIKLLLETLDIPSNDFMELLLDDRIEITKRISLFSNKVSDFIVRKKSEDYSRGTVNKECIIINSRDINGGNIIMANKSVVLNNTNNHNNNFDNIEKVIKENEETINNSKEVVKKVKEMKETVGSPAYLNKYKEFISLMANHITIIEPFIPYLSSLLN